MADFGKVCRMDDDIRQGFIRQRRGLFIITIVLFVIDIADVNVSAIKKIPLLGTGVQVGNPDALYYALWVAWGYWFWRYFQYFKKIGDKGFRSTYFGNLNRLISKRAIRETKETKEYKDLQDDVNINSLIKMRDPQVRRQMSSGFRVKLKGLSVKKGDMERDDHETSVQEEIAFPDRVYSPEDLRWLRVRAWLRVGVESHLFSEYLLPFIVAFVPVIAVCLE